jgi:16S rRNA processing protein RimM
MASSSRSAKDKTGLVTIGRIAAPHGLRGEVRVSLETDFPERFDGLRDAWLVHGDRVEAVAITGHRPHRGGLLVTLDGVRDLGAAERLRGAEIAVAREALVPLPEGQFYVFEIIGLRVRTAGGHILGRVAEVLRGPAHDIYVVRGEAGETLVPALRDVVRHVDRAAGEIVVDLPPGLETAARAR